MLPGRHFGSLNMCYECALLALLSSMGLKQDFLFGGPVERCLVVSDRCSCGRCIRHGASWIGCQSALGSVSCLSTYVRLLALVLLENCYM